MQPDLESKTKKEILQELRNYRTIFEISGAGIAIVEDDTTISSVNTAFEKLFGYSKEEIEGRQKWIELCVAEDRDRISGYHLQRREALTLAPHNYEARFIHKNGSFVDAYVTAVLLPETKQSILDLIDISDLKRTEEALHKSREELESGFKERTAELEKLNEALQAEAGDRKRAEDSFKEANAYLENLINYANAPIIVWGPDFKIIRFNRAFERLTGYRTVDVIGKSLEILFPDAQKEESMSLIHSATSGERWDVVEIAITHIDGTVRTVLWNSATLFAEDGVTIISTIAQGQDITERKRAEEIVSRQSREILEISTPVLQVWERIVVAPLIGTLDSMRTQQLMEQLLQRIVETNSLVAMIDVTGVPAIDTQTAQNLIETISAVRLLGAQVVLTGIRPAIAQTLVHLGIDLSNVNTCSSLSTGLGYALDLLKIQVVHKA
jgi:PAS domain S-box-containing protein